jgi:hypothetical protein
MKKEKLAKLMKKSHYLLTDPDERAKAKREMERKQRRDDKIKDTGL